MALTLTIQTPDRTVDYTQYLQEDTLQIKDQLNQPTTFQFYLNNWDELFEVPLRGAYVRIVSGKTGKTVITGIISSEPAARALGVTTGLPSTRAIAGPASTTSSEVTAVKQPGQPLFSWLVLCTSDEYLLNNKVAPFIPVFVNQTQGEILSTIADALIPGFIDTDNSNIASGDIVPYFVFNPLTSWSDLAKQFADASFYHYSLIDHKFVFQPYGDVPLGINYDETTGEADFDPFMLELDAMPIPILNDVLVIGQTEGGNYVTNVFIGDGFTSSFNLTHTPFHAQTDLYLDEEWQNSPPDPSRWYVVDPFSRLQVFQNTLNVLGASGSVATPLGGTSILLRNGLELAGTVMVQAGTFQFQGESTGILGGLYTDSSLELETLIAGFQVTVDKGTGLNIIAPIAYAVGINVPPVLSPSQNQGTYVSSVATLTQLDHPASGGIYVWPNHTYTLTMVINAYAGTRYNRWWRSVYGEAYGGNYLQSDGQVTWIIEDTDIAFPNDPFVTTYSQQLTLPEFCLFAPVNAELMNLTCNSTIIGAPAQATLTETLLAPSLTQISKNAADEGATTDATVGAVITETIGFGQMHQTATISMNGSGGSSSGSTGGTNSSYAQLQFYTDTIPAAQTLIVCSYREAQVAMGRVQEPQSIAEQAAISGDDGHRGAIISDLQPVPRTSAECELAAQAKITDSIYTVFSGVYHQVNDYFWDDQQDYPRTGRYLGLNAPTRNVVNNKVLIREVDWTCVEPKDEIWTWDLSYGQDTYFDRNIARYIHTYTSILRPSDAATAPTPLQMSEVGVNTIQDVNNLKVTAITSTDVTVNVVPPANALGVLEVRTSDQSWGLPNYNLVTRTGAQTFTLPRNSETDTFYIRYVSGKQISRYAAVLVVNAPLVPAAPIPSVDMNTDPLHPIVSLELQGNIEDVYGIEIRDGDNTTVLYRQVYHANSDLIYTYNNEVDSVRDLHFYAYTFNLLRAYSTAVNVDGSLGPPPAPIIKIQLLVNGGVALSIDQVQNHPIASTTVESASDENFETILQTLTFPGQPTSFTLPLNPQVVYIRAYRNDYLSQSPFSATLKVDSTALLFSSNGENICPSGAYQFNSATPFSFTGGAAIDSANNRCVMPPGSTVTSFFTDTGLPGGYPRITPGQDFTFTISSQLASAPPSGTSTTNLDFSILSASGASNAFSSQFAGTVVGTWQRNSIYLQTSDTSTPSFGWVLKNSTTETVWLTFYGVYRGRLATYPVSPLVDGGSAGPGNVGVAPNGGDLLPPTSGGIPLSLLILPTNPIVPGGSTTPVQFSANAQFANGTSTPVTNSSVWSLSGDTAVGSINSQTGLFTPNSVTTEGVAIINCNYTTQGQTITGDGTVTVLAYVPPSSGGGGSSPPPPPPPPSASPTGLTLSPQNIVLTVSGLNYNEPQSQQIYATLNYSDGTTKDVTTSAVWSSEDPTFATANAGLVTSSPLGQNNQGGGSTKINAFYAYTGVLHGGFSAQTTVTVQFIDQGSVGGGTSQSYS